jgi:hypothetical protein
VPEVSVKDSTLLLHVTPRANVPSILSRGVLPHYSKGRRQESWLVAPSKRAWAVAHVKRRHQTGSVVAFRVLVPRQLLMRRSRGTWTCATPILPSSILSVGIAELLASRDDAA